MKGLIKLTYTYKTSGVCARSIVIEVEGETVTSVKFEGGCNGNTKGISALVVGMNIDDVISKLDGINCGFKGTSCPDQLAKALREIKQDI